jgi:hypothetical protein
MLISFVACAIFVCGRDAAAVQTRDMPGYRVPAQPLVSPSGQWAIDEVGYDYRERAHKLILRNLRTHTLASIIDFPRWATVGWAPDSAHFFVTDNFASDVSEVYVYDPLTLHRVQLSPQLKRMEQLTKYFICDPHYLRAEWWKSDRTLQLHFYGFGCEESNGGSTGVFDIVLVYDLAGGFRIVSAKATRGIVGI